MRIKCFTMSLLLVAGALLFGETNTRLMAQELTGGKRVKISEVDVADLNSDGKVTTDELKDCLLYSSPSPRDKRQSRMPSSA